MILALLALMAYPYQIDPTGDLNNGARGPAYPAVRIGPFEYGSPPNLYVVLHGEFDDTHEVWVSTDDGENWTEADSANKPSNHASHVSFNVFRDGDTLYVSYVDASETISVIPFDMGAGTWGTAITGGPTPYAVTGSPNIPSISKFQVVRRSDGSYVAVYESRESVSGSYRSRIYYAVYSGSAWGTPAQVDTYLSGTTNHSGFIGATIGADDRVHVFWIDSLWWTTMHRTLEADDSLGDMVLIPALPQTTDNPPFSPPLAYEDDCGNTYVVAAGTAWNLTALALPYNAATTLRLCTWQTRSDPAGSPADDGAFRFECDIFADDKYGPSDYPFSGGGGSLSLLWDDGTLYAFWLSKGEEADATYKLMHAANAGAGWGDPVELYDAGTSPVHRAYAEKITAGVGVVLVSEEPNSDTFSQPHYWQGELTATAPVVCGASVAAEGCVYYGY